MRNTINITADDFGPRWRPRALGGVLLAALMSLSLRAGAFTFDWGSVAFAPITLPSPNQVYTYTRDFANVDGSGINVRATFTVAVGTSGNRGLEEPIQVNTAEGIIQELQLYPNFGSRGGRQIGVDFEFFAAGGFTTPVPVTVTGLNIKDVDGAVLAGTFRDVVTLSIGTGPTVVGTPPTWEGAGTGTARGICDTTVIGPPISSVTRTWAGWEIGGVSGLMSGGTLYTRA